MKAVALLIAFLVVAGLAIWIGIEMRHDPGYVMIAYKGWSVETSVWITIAAALIVFVAVYLLIWSIGVGVRLPQNLRRWRGAQTERKAVRLTNLGICELAEGRWKQAEKSLVSGIKNNDATFINYLAAARAAQAQKEYTRRDEYLHKAHKQVKGSRLAIGLTQAQLEIGSKQWEKAATTLSHLHKESPKHPFILELLSRLYLELRDWDGIKNILPLLKKYRAIDQMLIEGIEEKLYAAELEHAAQNQEPQNLLTAWKQIPKQWRQDNHIKKQYVYCLLQQGFTKEAEPEISAILKNNWEPEIVTKYSKLEEGDFKKHLNTAEGWAKKYPDKYLAYLACGRICFKMQLWGKAKDYLEQSINLEEQAEAYQLLGKVFEQQNEESLAMECYRKGLNLSAATMPIEKKSQ